MSRRLRVALAALAVVAAAAGCGDAKAGKAEETTATEVPLTLPSTTERQVSEPEPDEPEEPEPPPTTVPVPTTLATGLPSDLGIPGAGDLFLGGGSSLSNGFDVRDVPIEEVVAFVLAELQELGWVAQVVPSGEPPPASNDTATVIQFEGPGAIGQARVAPEADGTVDVDIVITGR